jgi:hypothetical protein
MKGMEISHAQGFNFPFIKLKRKPYLSQYVMLTPYLSVFLQLEFIVLAVGLHYYTINFSITWTMLFPPSPSNYV